jgi:hypothetical protein
MSSKPVRRVAIADWLPPDFGAVGQYAVLFSREYAEQGQHVTLVGLSSTASSEERESVGAGELHTIRVFAPSYQKNRLLKRAWWTLQSNLALLRRAWRAMRAADEIVFTGSPPFFLHFIAPLRFLLKARLVYRITDFHPECLMAEFEKVPFGLKLLHRYTLFWRAQIPAFEALGNDQIVRLEACGIDRSRVTLKRDPTPVAIPANTEALPIPESLQGAVVLLYSGNFGVAHEHTTFIEGYRKHHQEGSARVKLWLNATGAKADLVEQALKEAGLPVLRSQPVALEKLPNLLVTPHAHLICLRDPFVGYVLPSKVYGCISSRKDVLYVGSRSSDVDLLCRSELSEVAYQQVNVGEPNKVFLALEALAARHA